MEVLNELEEMDSKWSNTRPETLEQAGKVLLYLIPEKSKVKIRRAVLIVCFMAQKEK